MVVCTVLIVGTRFAAWVNNAAVFVEVLCGIVAAAALLIVAIVAIVAIVGIVRHPHRCSSGPLRELKDSLTGMRSSGRVPSTQAGSLPADVAEETKDAPNTAARTMLWSIGAVAASSP
jgi:hypothetical protein